MALIRDFLSIGQINKPVLDISMHRHDVWELVYYTYGSGVMTVGGTRYSFKKGDIMLLPAGIPHSEKSECGYRNYHILFARSSHAKREDYIFITTDNDGADVLHILQLIYRTFHLKPLNWPQILQKLFDTLDGYLSALTGVKDKNPYVDKVESIIIDNISDSNFKLDEAIAELPVSKEYLRRLFKKHTGRPPLEFLIQKRLEYAAKLLETGGTSLRIKDIAYMSGFGDAYYFSRIFSKYYGESPRHWPKKS